MNTSRGFISLGLALAIAIVAAAILGGAGWWATQQKSENTSSISSATIDQNSLETHASRPTLSGTAQVPSVTVNIYDFSTKPLVQGSGSTKVEKGRWEYKPCFPLKEGKYRVQVLDSETMQYDHENETGMIANPEVSLLASGTLTIQSPVSVEETCAHD